MFNVTLAIKGISFKIKLKLFAECFAQRGRLSVGQEPLLCSLKLARDFVLETDRKNKQLESLQTLLWPGTVCQWKEGSVITFELLGLKSVFISTLVYQPESNSDPWSWLPFLGRCSVMLNNNVGKCTLLKEQCYREERRKEDREQSLWWTPEFTNSWPGVNYTDIYTLRVLLLTKDSFYSVQ